MTCQCFPSCWHHASTVQLSVCTTLQTLHSSSTMACAPTQTFRSMCCVNSLRVSFAFSSPSSTCWTISSKQTWGGGQFVPQFCCWFCHSNLLWHQFASFSACANNFCLQESTLVFSEASWLHFQKVLLLTASKFICCASYSVVTNTGIKSLQWCFIGATTLIQSFWT